MWSMCLLFLKKIVVENDGNMHICSIVLIRNLMLTIQKVLAIQSTCFLHILGYYIEIDINVNVMDVLKIIFDVYSDSDLQNKVQTWKHFISSDTL